MQVVEIDLINFTVGNLAASCFICSFIKAHKGILKN
jgi:hypothetical protein